MGHEMSNGPAPLNPAGADPTAGAVTPPPTPAPTPAAVAPAAAAPVFRPNAKYVLLLGVMTALPDVARDLHTSAAAAQLTMTAMLIGGAVGQLVIGPLSDRFGRRRPVLIGVALHVLTSLLCAVAPAIVPLIALRTVQGFFNASASVVAMAVIRDRFVGPDASRLLSRLMLVIGVAPLFAPSVGGLIAGDFGWRGVFVALALYGAVLWVVVLRRLPETLPVERRIGSTAGAWRGYRVLLPGLGQAVLMSYVVGSPFVLREGFGLSANQFALVFAVNGVGLVVGAQINAALVRRFAPIQIIRTALPVSFALTVVLLVLALTEAGGLPALLVALFLILSLVNFTPPNASAIALSRHGERAGTAAAFIGCLQAGVAGVVSPLVGVLGEDAGAMATVMCSAAGAALLVLALATPAYRRGGWTTADAH
jgi:DHA1 family bicyclomycin/chloramphenicol resistance-like MFS transporter